MQSTAPFLVSIIFLLAHSLIRLLAHSLTRSLAHSLTPTPLPALVSAAALSVAAESRHFGTSPGSTLDAFWFCFAPCELYMCALGLDR